MNSTLLSSLSSNHSSRICTIQTFFEVPVYVQSKYKPRISVVGWAQSYVDLRLVWQVEFSCIQTSILFGMKGLDLRLVRMVGSRLLFRAIYTSVQCGRLGIDYRLVWQVGSRLPFSLAGSLQAFVQSGRFSLDFRLVWQVRYRAIQTSVQCSRFCLVLYTLPFSVAG